MGAMQWPKMFLSILAQLGCHLGATCGPSTLGGFLSCLLGEWKLQCFDCISGSQTIHTGDLVGQLWVKPWSNSGLCCLAPRSCLLAAISLWTALALNMARTLQTTCDWAIAKAFGAYTSK